MATKNYNMKFTMSNGQVINCPFTIPVGTAEGLSKVEWVNSLLSNTDRSIEISLQNVAKMELYLYVFGFNDGGLTVTCKDTLFSGTTADTESLIHFVFCGGIAMCTEYANTGTKSSYTLSDSSPVSISVSPSYSTCYVQVSGYVIYD